MENNVGGTATKVSLQISIHVLKEPRGFIRVLQFIFTIFAFSTTSGFSTIVKFVLNGCNDNETIVINISYPFNLEDIDIPICTNISFIGDFSSQAEYFVIVGVLTLVLCIAVIAVYVAFEHIYQENLLVPATDFVVTAVFVVLWLTASAVWAQGVSDLKYFGNPDTLFKSVSSCSPSLCTTVFPGSYATLNVSLIFGFSNFALWAASLWFIYKETHWFRIRQGNIG